MSFSLRCGGLAAGDVELGEVGAPVLVEGRPGVAEPLPQRVVGLALQPRRPSSTRRAGRAAGHRCASTRWRWPATRPPRRSSPWSSVRPLPCGRAGLVGLGAAFSTSASTASSRASSPARSPTACASVIDSRRWATVVAASLGGTPPARIRCSSSTTWPASSSNLRPKYASASSCGRVRVRPDRALAVGGPHEDRAVVGDPAPLRRVRGRDGRHRRRCGGGRGRVRHLGRRRGVRQVARRDDRCRRGLGRGRDRARRRRARRRPVRPAGVGSATAELGDGRFGGCGRLGGTVGSAAGAARLGGCGRRLRAGAGSRGSAPGRASAPGLGRRLGLRRRRPGCGLGDGVGSVGGDRVGVRGRRARGPVAAAAWLSAAARQSRRGLGGSRYRLGLGGLGGLRSRGRGRRPGPRWLLRGVLGHVSPSRPWRS